MRKFVFILIFTIPFIVFAQKKSKEDIALKIKSEFEEMKKNFTESEDEWIFQKVVEVSNKSKDDIYQKSLEVLANIYKDSKEVIQNKDKEAGVIVGKGIVDSDFRTINWTTVCRNRCWHLVKIDIKDNKYRITLTVNSVFYEAGSDLRHPFDGTEYGLHKFYPYFTNCKPKLRNVSFDSLRFVYNSSLYILNSLEKEINQKLEESNDW